MLVARVARLSGYLLLTLGLLSALPLSFGQVVQASESVTSLSTPYVHHLWGNNKRLPATLTAWKEVDLAYARLFPYDRARQPHPPAGCVVLPAISTRIDRQGPGIKTIPAVLMLRCRERIDLLRPAQWVNNREQQQYRQGYLLVSMPEMGITDVRVHIVAIKSSLFNSAILSMKHALSRPVTGVFIRHTMNVKQYTFKDTITGKLERIKATPNHPFYVVNRQRYLPVSQLSPHDQMVNVLGHSVVIVCSAGKSSHCGQPYHPGQVITVYNLEVYGQHRYFVGEPGTMVHNVYYCGICGQQFRNKDRLEIHMFVHNVVDDAEFYKKPLYKYQCAECKDSTFDREEDLQEHLKTHWGKTPYECKSCDKSFATEREIIGHLRTRSHKFNASASIKGDDIHPDALLRENLHSFGIRVIVRERSRSPLSSKTLTPPEDSTPDLPKDDDSGSWLENYWKMPF